MEKQELTVEEEKALYDLWKKGRENAVKKQLQEMKKRTFNLRRINKSI